jgi:hypothetical protein
VLYECDLFHCAYRGKLYPRGREKVSNLWTQDNMLRRDLLFARAENIEHNALNGSVS